MPSSKKSSEKKKNTSSKKGEVRGKVDGKPARVAVIADKNGMKYLLFFREIPEIFREFQGILISKTSVLLLLSCSCSHVFL